MIVQSNGWGMQSVCILAMQVFGDLPHVDVVLHADTTHESILTYQYRERWEPWFEEKGLKMVTVQQDPTPDPLSVREGIGIPAFTATEKGGTLNRQCTYEWKTRPIRRWLQANRNGEPVIQWLGISMDEYRRMKPSDVKYITHTWPLIDAKMTRADCVKYLEAHNIEIPPRSACTFCPYHNTAEWRRIKATPEDWREAVEVDNAIRKARPPYDLFVHPSRKPLEEVDFRTAEEKGQLSLWDNECEGLCGV